MTLLKKLTGVYAITDNKLLPDDKLLPAAEQALKGGISVLQYRYKSDAETNLSFAQQQLQTTALVRLCHQYQAMLLVNDNIDLCLAAGADGVHLGQGDTKLSDARRLLGPAAVIGITCHNKDELVIAAEQQGADYIALGRFFPSTTKPDAAGASIDDLKRIRQLTRLPIVAIGGVNADNGAELIAAGADMLAVVHYLFSADLFSGSVISSDLIAGDDLASDTLQQRAQVLSQLFTHTRSH